MIFLKKGSSTSKVEEAQKVGRTGDPKYGRYHKMVSHLLEKCITLKESIIRLVEDGTIKLDLDDVIETNNISCENEYIFYKIPRDCLSSIWKFGALCSARAWVAKLCHTRGILHSQRFQ